MQLKKDVRFTVHVSFAKNVRAVRLLDVSIADLESLEVIACALAPVRPTATPMAQRLTTTSLKTETTTGIKSRIANVSAASTMFRWLFSTRRMSGGICEM